MNEIHFIWDENKNKLNKKKHGISFEEAKDEDSTIRIISAREATKKERKIYQKGW